jgi:molybdate transport system regulatory protein
MARSRWPVVSKRLLPRLRLLRGREIALGPGKADLLEAIRDCGTLSSAARGLELSYMRAWTLVRTMNACFKAPLVVLARGGAERGRARLSPAGEQALALYRRMETAATQACARDAAALRRRLKP